jgi:hypothetical protein
MKNLTKKQLFKCLDEVLRRYDGAGYKVKTILTDQQFCSVIDKVKDQLDVDTNPTTTGQHQNEAERNIRTIKERI